MVRACGSWLWNRLKANSSVIRELDPTCTLDGRAPAVQRPAGSAACFSLVWLTTRRCANSGKIGQKGQILLDQHAVEALGGAAGRGDRLEVRAVPIEIGQDLPIGRA